MYNELCHLYGIDLYRWFQVNGADIYRMVSNSTIIIEENVIPLQKMGHDPDDDLGIIRGG
jgi:hypothetical protein